MWQSKGLSTDIKLRGLPTHVIAYANNVGRTSMAKGEQRSNREKKKPKKEKVKTIATAPSQKGAAAGWQPSLGASKKK